MIEYVRKFTFQNCLQMRCWAWFVFEVFLAARDLTVRPLTRLFSWEGERSRLLCFIIRAWDGKSNKVCSSSEDVAGQKHIPATSYPSILQLFVFFPPFWINHSMWDEMNSVHSWVRIGLLFPQNHLTRILSDWLTILIVWYLFFLNARETAQAVCLIWERLPDTWSLSFKVCFEAVQLEFTKETLFLRS